jgi:hypothetical protein
VLRGERLPPGLGAVEAAAVWMAYPTAYGALIEIGRLAGGETIITAASSDVGLAAIHIANTAGAVPIATTRTAGTSGGTRSAQPETSGVDTASGKIRETARTAGRPVRIYRVESGGPVLDRGRMIEPGGLGRRNKWTRRGYRPVLDHGKMIEPSGPARRIK